MNDVPNLYQISNDYFSDLMQKISDLFASIGSVPEIMLKERIENPHTIDKAFDLNSFMNIFSHIHMDEGFILDYVYYTDGETTGFPLPYIHHEEDDPITTLADFHSKHSSYGQYGPPEGVNLFQHAVHPYTWALLIDGSAESYIEMFIYMMKVSRFYLFWHANSKNRCFLNTLDNFQEIADDYRLKSVNEENRYNILMPTTDPVVYFEKKTVTVQVLSADITFKNFHPDKKEEISILTLVFDRRGKLLDKYDIVLQQPEYRIIF